MKTTPSASLFDCRNFDFLAYTFASMVSRGRKVNLNNITSSMSPENKAWFIARYEFYLRNHNAHATTD